MLFVLCLHFVVAGVRSNGFLGLGEKGKRVTCNGFLGLGEKGTRVTCNGFSGLGEKKKCHTKRRFTLICIVLFSSKRKTT